MFVPETVLFVQALFAVADSFTCNPVEAGLASEFANGASGGARFNSVVVILFISSYFSLMSSTASPTVVSGVHPEINPSL